MENFKGQAFGFSVLALALAASAAPCAAASAYTPTMADMLSIQTAIHAYATGLDKLDGALEASGFTEDGVLSIIDNGQEVAHLAGRKEIAGGRKAPTNAPLPAGGPPSEAGIWHFYGNDYFEFQGPSHATHYGYWLDVTAPVVKPGESGVGKLSTVGLPGHYEDVFLKVDGAWLFKQRTIYVGAK